MVNESSCMFLLKSGNGNKDNVMSDLNFDTNTNHEKIEQYRLIFEQ